MNLVSFIYKTLPIGRGIDSLSVLELVILLDAYIKEHIETTHIQEE